MIPQLPSRVDTRLTRLEEVVALVDGGVSNSLLATMESPDVFVMAGMPPQATSRLSGLSPSLYAPETEVQFIMVETNCESEDSTARLGIALPLIDTEWDHGGRESWRSLNMLAGAARLARLCPFQSSNGRIPRRHASRATQSSDLDLLCLLAFARHDHHETTEEPKVAMKTVSSEAKSRSIHPRV